MKLRLQKEQLERLSQLLGVEKNREYQWLGYVLNLETGNIRDRLPQDKRHTEFDVRVLTVLLSHYILAKPMLKTGKLVKFKDLPGGYAYERALLQRAAQPLVEAFGEKPAEIVEAAKLLGGKSLALGDASVELTALEGIPIVYVVWAKGEFPASATVLFDESASSYLPTEDLAVLAELTTSRLVKAGMTKKNKD